jgi:hypothetical protein
VVTWSKLRVLNRSLAGFAGLILAGAITLSVMVVVCCQVEASSRNVLPSVVRLNVIAKPLNEKVLAH